MSRISSPNEMIEAMRREAEVAGDEAQAEMCERAAEYVLRDADTNYELDAAELGVDATEYVRLVCESLDTPGTGIVECVVRCLPRRRVYAA